MKHFLNKSKLTIMGAGGGGPPAPPPPVVVQFPSVLTPPQMGDTNAISSFSYAEMIDLLSDGPIEGLINRDGKKLYDENIYEGIYLNDTPIKESSARDIQFIPMGFIKDKLKSLWKINEQEYRTLTKDQELNLLITEQEVSIFDKNFTGPIQITSYHPDNSVLKFIELTTKNFDSIELLNRAFELIPVKQEKLFLTKITIPRIRAFLNSNLFDSTEGGVNQDYPINLDIPNLGNHFYFSIGSENLNSFNYFEMPRTFLRKSYQTPSGKNTVIKNLISVDSNFLQYDFLNIEIFIWSIYDEELGIKKIEDALDRYFNYIYVYQNRESLFNYNLVQAEFKNGSEIQAPLRYFKNVQIDTEYNKELVGPFKIKNALSPINSAFAPGGVARICDYAGGGFSNLTDNDIKNETSDDIRWVKNWPVEYRKNGNPFIARSVRFNYAIYDKTSAQKSEQKAVPVTHYINNNNVEDIYVTISVNALNDMAHIDMSTSTSAHTTLGITKSEQLDDVPKGFKTYGDILNPNRYSFSSNSSKVLLAVDDGTYFNIIGGGDDITIVNTCISEVINKSKTYYDAISEFSKIYTKNSNVSTDKTLEELFSPKYSLATMSNGFTLKNYLIPTQYCALQGGFRVLKNQLDPSSFDAKLKTKNDDNSLFYEFGLRDRDLVSTVVTSAYSATSTTTNFGILPAGNTLATITVNYKTAATSSTSTRYVISTKINSIIPWHEIFASWQFSTTNYRIGSLAENLTSYHALFSPNKYINIYNYIVYPFLKIPAVNGARSSTSIQDIFLIGLNKAYLEQQTSFWKKVSQGNAYYLSLDALENLLEEFSLKNINLFDYYTYGSTSVVKTTSITNYSLTKLLENNLIKFENGKLLNVSNIYSVTFTDVSQDKTDSLYASNLASNKNFYNDVNIYLYNNSFSSITQKAKILTASSILFSNLDYAYGESAFHADTIITYTLFIDSATYLENKVTNGSTFSEFKSIDGSWILEPKDPTLSPSILRNACQTVAAGTKLPTTVKIQIETGYETEENSSPSLVFGNYFCYCFDIYGISTDQARIDIGRSSHPSVKSFLANLSRLADRSSNFYKNQKAYTLEIEHFSNGSLVDRSGFLKNTLVGTFFEDFCLSNIKTGTHSRLDDEVLNYFGLEKDFCPFSAGGPSYAKYNSIYNAFECYTKYWEPNLLLDQNHLYCDDLYYAPYTKFSDQNLTKTYFTANLTDCIENPYRYNTYKIKCDTDPNCFLVLKVKEFTIESFDNLTLTDPTINYDAKGYYSNEFIIFTHGLISGNVTNNQLTGFNYCPQYRAISHEMVKDYFGSNAYYSGFDYLYYKSNLGMTKKSLPSKFGSFLSDVICESSTSWPITTTVNANGGNTIKVDLKNNVSPSHFSSILHLSHEYITESNTFGFSSYGDLADKIDATNNCTALTSNAKLLTSAGFTEITSNYSNIFNDSNQQNFCLLLEKEIKNAKTYCSVIELSKTDIRNKLCKYFTHNECAIDNLFFDGADLYLRSTAAQKTALKNLSPDVSTLAQGVNRIFDKTYYDYINKTNADGSANFLRVFQKQIPNSSAFVNAIYIKTITELKDKRYDILLENRVPGLPIVPIVIYPKIWIIHDKKLNVILVIMNDWGNGSIANKYVNTQTGQGIEDHIDIIRLDWFREESPATISLDNIGKTAVSATVGSAQIVYAVDEYGNQMIDQDGNLILTYLLSNEYGGTILTAIELNRLVDNFITSKVEVISRTGPVTINWNDKNYWLFSAVTYIGDPPATFATVNDNKELFVKGFVVLSWIVDVPTWAP